MFLISPAIIVFSFPFEIQFKRWIVITLFVFYIIRKCFYKPINSRNFPLKRALIWMFLGSLVLIVFDSRFSIFYRFIYPILDAFDVYIVLYFAYFLSQYVPFNKHYNYIVICVFISVLYGLFNYITGLNPVSSLVDSIYTSGDGYSVDVGSRQYVKSFSRYVFDFGYNCSVMSLCFLYNFMKNRKTGFLEYLALIMAFLGVVLCGSRTMLITAVFSILVLMLITLNVTKLFKYLLVIGCFSMIAYLSVPPITEMVDMTINTIFHQSNEVTGSSIEMRMNQLSGAISLWSQDPIFGNGYKYIFNELSLSENNYSTEMAGYESLVFSLLIERGVVGIIVYLIFFITLFIYFYNNRYYRYSQLGIAIMAAFLASAIGTGTLDSWCNTMILCGFIIGSIEKQKMDLKQSNYLLKTS